MRIDPIPAHKPAQSSEADPHAQAKAHFARYVADRLNEAVRTGEVDEIVLAAPAHVRHDIREQLNKARRQAW